ncbi:MAG: hypothetical protein GAK37_03104 [Pseudomonas sp.]|nr:MAG: hypothetical protein GAK37_03104 [Pseudomonas sp.]
MEYQKKCTGEGYRLEKPAIQTVMLVCWLAFISGCSPATVPNSFTFTADLPPNFMYDARAVYVPDQGETCTVPGGRNTQVGYNIQDPSNDYKPDSEVLLRRTVSGCPLVLERIVLAIRGRYGEKRGDSSYSRAIVGVRYTLDEELKTTFDAAGNSEFQAQCQWFFRTSGAPRVLRKLLECKNTGAGLKLTRGSPLVVYTLDQLPGKTVRLKVTMLDEELPSWKDTWVKVPGGWKRCRGDDPEDQHAYCHGNYTDFTTFTMVDGRTCTIYPGCTEDKEVAP